MTIDGLSLCTRFAYPPNSLSLCGPEKQTDLYWYTRSGNADKGTIEILSSFHTLFPYLRLIAAENRILSPFDKRVVEAYWLGNQLLHAISPSSFIKHLEDDLSLKKKLPKKRLQALYTKLPFGALPHHAFHVLNVWKRTGHIDDVHSVQTMDACMINWGTVIRVLPTSLVIKTQSLRQKQDVLFLDQSMIREIQTLGKNDSRAQSVHTGDIVTYHWGRFCEKITIKQRHNLSYYTQRALIIANTTVSTDEKMYLYTR